MVIQHNISALNSYRNLSVNQKALSKNLEKLSSGYKINRAADDAAGLAISESMRSKINGLTQAEANANDAVGLIQTEEGALTETHSMLQRMTTLATQAANGTYSTQEEGKTARSAIQAEISELAQEITRIATSTKYNGLSPLNNSSTIKLQIGPTSGETLTISDQVMSATALSVNGLKMSTVSQANTAISKIRTAINKVSAYRAKLGAKQNRLEHTINNLQVTNENVTAAESRIRDTDMAKEIASYTKNSVLQQAAQSMLAQANQTPQGVLSLLQ
ncbi:MAG: flagellin [Lachnospiraceae bacterium]|jgi:flagellin|nr:flagellin [Lachnospiraceae bacterium]MCH4028450.1 flagellin [Lachnospiraceae bacterium]MCH4066299.1 flagellin [Lachnospiraceae bacterium]MCH4112330.1 flagellin [Lachnospiraceae bacterium]MCI1353309.1 flagellin [Lachnospiraceae bacterium]